MKLSIKLLINTLGTNETHLVLGENYGLSKSSMLALLPVLNSFCETIVGEKFDANGDNFIEEKDIESAYKDGRCWFRYGDYVIDLYVILSE